jgi:hypothetical protein
VVIELTGGFGGPPVSGLPPGGVVHVGRRRHHNDGRGGTTVRHHAIKPGALPDAESNLNKVLDRVTGVDCQQAAKELERYLDAGLTATRELLAAFLNDLNDECLARWGPRDDSGQAASLSAPPN